MQHDESGMYTLCERGAEERILRFRVEYFCTLEERLLVLLQPAADLIGIELDKNPFAAYLIGRIPVGVRFFDGDKACVGGGGYGLHAGESEKCIDHADFVDQRDCLDVWDMIGGDVCFLTGEVTDVVGWRCAHRPGECRELLTAIGVVKGAAVLRGIPLPL